MKPIARIAVTFCAVVAVTAVHADESRPLDGARSLEGQASRPAVDRARRHLVRGRGDDMGYRERRELVEPLAAGD